MGIYYDIDGQPIDMMTWAKLLEDFPGRQIGEFADERLRISTVWLGLDHNRRCGGRPLIFETMIFLKEGADVAPEFNEAQWRWHTKEEAKDGHDTLVHCYREGIDPEGPIRAVREKHRAQ
jgi:hypothetical protein